MLTFSALNTLGRNIIDFFAKKIFNQTSYNINTYKFHFFHKITSLTFYTDLCIDLSQSYNSSFYAMTNI